MRNENIEIRGNSLSTRWNGGFKYITKECASCEGFQETETGKVCKLGIAWKFLTDEKILNTCSLKKMVEKQQAIQKAIDERPLHPVIIYTPTLMDLADGTLFRLQELGWRNEMVPSDMAHPRGSVVIEFRKGD